MRYSQSIVRGVYPAIGILLMFFVWGCSGNGGDSGDKTDPEKDVSPPGKVILTGITVVETEIIFSWKDPSDSDLEYIEIICTGDIDSTTVNVQNGVEVYIIEGLTGNKNYSITVRAADSSGNLSEANTFSIITTTGTGIVYTKISTADELDNVRNRLNGHYLLVADIDLSGYGGGTWTPIGNDSSHFSGVFNGNGLVIRNLYINIASDHQGLFGCIGTSGKVEQLGLEGIDVTTDGDYTGGLAGENKGKITNSYASGAVTGDGFYTGGLVGYNVGRITGSYATGVVKGYKYTGCLTGHNFQGGKIINCYATGKAEGTTYTGGLVGLNNYGEVSDSYATGQVSGQDGTGGLAGTNFEANIRNCYATGKVEGSTNTGGLLGANKAAEVSDSYATGQVTGQEKTGGLVGFNEVEITLTLIINCYATGKVDGNTNTGGLVGENTDTVLGSFYDKDTTLQDDDEGKGTPKTTAEMKTKSTCTDAGWDFMTPVWSIDASGVMNGGYPYLVNLQP